MLDREIHFTGGPCGPRVSLALIAQLALACAITVLTARFRPALTQPVTTTQPGAGAYNMAAIICPAADACYAVGGDTVVAITGGVAGVAQRVSATLKAVACASSDTCFAVGSTDQSSSASGTMRGVVVPIIDGVAGAPQPVEGVSDLGGIACPSSDTCYTVGVMLEEPAGF